MDDTLLWSDDSRSLLFSQIDRRNVKSRVHINHVPVDGSLESVYTDTKESYAGDEVINSYQLFVINISSGDRQNIDYPAIPEMSCGYCFEGFFSSGLVWWSADFRRVFFVDFPRDVRTVRVVEWDIQKSARQSASSLKRPMKSPSDCAITAWFSPSLPPYRARRTSWSGSPSALATGPSIPL